MRMIEFFGRGSRHWDLRASDADRERVVEDLREHCAVGRLTLDEFSARLDGAYAARTYRDLAWITRDLPRLEKRPQRPRPRPSRLGIGPLILGNSAFTAVWLALEEVGDSDFLEFPWPALTIAASAALVSFRARRQQRRGSRLGLRRDHFEVTARDRWQPGAKPPAWLAWRQLLSPPPQPSPRPWAQPPGQGQQPLRDA